MHAIIKMCAYKYIIVIRKVAKYNGMYIIVCTK